MVGSGPGVAIGTTAPHLGMGAVVQGLDMGGALLLHPLQGSLAVLQLCLQPLRVLHRIRLCS